MNFINNFFKKVYSIFFIGFNYEKKIDNAYLNLKENDKLKLVDKILLEIEKKKIFNESNNFDVVKKKILYSKKYEKTLDQILHLKYIVQSNFVSYLIVSISKNKTLSYPLPKKWISILRNNGVKVNNFVSQMLFIFSGILFFTKDIYKLILVFFSSSDNLNYKNTIIYLDNLPNIDLEKNIDNDKYNFLTWAKKFLNLNNQITFIHSNNKISNKSFSNIKIQYVKNFYFNNISIIQRLYFIIYLLYSIIFFLFYILKGKTYFLYFLENFFIVNWLNKFDLKLPRYAIFNISNCMVRPWWTYSIDKDKQKRVFMFFYSTNHFPLYSYNRSFFGCRLMSWSNYVFWSEEQANWLKEINNDFKNFDFVGYFPFIGKNKDISKKKKIVSLFPVTPFNNHYIYKNALSQNYYNLKNSINFLNDIIDCLKDFDIQILVKLKRNNPMANQDYIKYINFIKENEKIELIEPDISAISIVEKSNLVISAPFSSTSFIANNFKIPSVFYDSSNTLIQPEPHIKKIELIKTKSELNEWIKININ